MRYITLLLLLGIIAACNNNNTASNNNADSSTANNNSADTTKQATLELVFSDSTYQLTGVAKEPGGKLLVNYPKWSGPYRYAVVADSPGKPYAKDIKWVCVQSVYFDDKGELWILDPAAPKLKTIQGGGAKLVKMNKTNGTAERTYSFNGIIPDTAYMNDVRVDTKINYAYLTESKVGGIVVIDLTSGKTRRLLSNHPSTKSDPSFKYIIDGHELMKDGKPAKFNSDGIALSPDGDWLYYKSITDDKLYRIRTQFLRDSSISDSVLGPRVQDLGHFASTDGMILDSKGNLYLGDPRTYSIIKISPDMKMTTLIKDERLIWPDSYSIADGYLYISCSQIHKQPDYNDGVNKRTSPYTVYRLKL